MNEEEVKGKATEGEAVQEGEQSNELLKEAVDLWEELDELLDEEDESNKALILVIQKDGNLVALLDSQEEYTDEQMAMFARVYMLRNPSWVLWVVLLVEIWFTEAMLLLEEKKPVLLDKWETLKDEVVRLVVLLGAYWSSLCVWSRGVSVSIKDRLKGWGLDKKWRWIREQMGKIVGSLFEK